jgi:hypothetical protein
VSRNRNRNRNRPTGDSTPPGPDLPESPVGGFSTIWLYQVPNEFGFNSVASVIRVETHDSLTPPGPVPASQDLIYNEDTEEVLLITGVNDDPFEGEYEFSVIRAVFGVNLAILPGHRLYLLRED